MWFGTWNGLNRYDGYTFKIYKKQDNAHSLSSNFIHSICEDRKGNLWIGTRNGLNMLDFVKDCFLCFYNDSLANQSLAGNWINAVYCDKSGSVWVGTNGQGLDRVIYDSINESYYFEHFSISSNNSLKLSSDIIRSIYEDSKGRLWIGTNNGLNLYNRDLNTVTIFNNDPFRVQSISFDEIRCVYEDTHQTIWIGTQYGLNRWIEGTSDFIRYLSNSDDPNSLSHFHINDIGEDPEGNLYIGTLGGLNIYDTQAENFKHLPVQWKVNLSLNNEFVNSIYCDKTGLVWIGTEKGGINKFNIYQKQFMYYAAEPADTIRLNHNTVNSILDESEYLWIGTAGGGLNLIDKGRRKAFYYSNDPHRTNSLSSDFITSICRDNKKNLWIGTWGSGFTKMISSKGNGEFITFQHDASDPNSLINNFVSTIYEDNKGNIWVGTEGGLDLFHPEKNSFIHIFNQPRFSIPVTEVGCILRDSYGNLWVGTRNGLFLIPSEVVDNVEISSNSGNIIYLQNDPEHPGSLSESYVISLFEDSKKRIWVGTYGNGLNKVIWNGDPQEEIRFIHYTQEQGLSNNVIYGILEDEDEYLWLSTDYGLARFDSKKEKFSNYFVADGLRSNQFYWSACSKGIDGTLYFGGMNGVNYFHPKEIANNQNQPIPVLTEFKVYNNPVEPGKPSGRRIILNKVISETKEIRLNYKENTFSLEFSGLSYNLQDKNRYAYKLEGVDEDWITVSSDRRFANYTKLKGGEYTFFLKAANNDGLWNQTPLDLKIVITPPFWQRNWFRTLIVVFLMSMIVLYLKLHTRSLQLQKRKLEQQVKERTAQIENQKEILKDQAEKLQETNTQLAKRQELIEGQKVKLENQNREILEQRDRLIQLNKKVKATNQLKLKFFTNISHEFRTPLTLILGPLEKLLKNTKMGAETKDLLSLINRNAERLLHLINQLMEFRKIEKGKMKLHVQQGEISNFLQNILYAFHDLAQQHHIKLEFSSEGKEQPAWFDHEKLENIIYNLFSNAFKYTPEGGKVWIKVTFVDNRIENDKEVSHKLVGHQAFLEIEVGDTGIGISKDKLPYIFKRFYRAESANDITQGTGIGLSLTRELVKVHRGHISVKSEAGKGTVFTIQIPYLKKVFTSEEITDAKLSVSSLPNQVSMLKNMLEAERNKVTDYQGEKWIKYIGRPTLLIVEDNFELGEFVASRLNQTFNIHLAGDGEEAFELAVKRNPDLIVSDIMMPVSDGLELCSRIKQNISTSHIPVILLTAKGTVENQIEGFKTGADEYIPKPFNLDLLETRVKNLIESRMLLRQAFYQKQELRAEELTENPIDQKFLKEALTLIERNLDNTEFGVNEFASTMCVSRSLLHKKLSALTDQSATDFINTIRLKKSRELMVSGTYNVSEVAYAVGYNDPKYFSRLFRKHFGISPTDYLKEMRVKAS